MEAQRVLKTFGSGVLVYVIVAACGTSHRDSPNSVGHNSFGGDHGQNVAGRSSSAGQNAQVAGIGDMLMDPVTDAMGQDGTCGSCTVDGPITVDGAVKLEQPVKMVTADSDVAQHIGGKSYPGDTPTSLVEGPAFITDLHVNGSELSNGFAYIFSAKAGDCSSKTGQIDLTIAASSSRQRGDLTSIHAARYFLAEGESLCLTGAISPGTLSWAGFRPY